MLVLWAGLDAAGDTWELLDNLPVTNCKAIAANEQASGCTLPRPAGFTAWRQVPAPLARPRQSSRQDTRSTLRLRATWARRSWAGRCSSERHSRASLSAQRILARGGLHPADVGAALHGRHANPLSDLHCGVVE